MQEMTSGVTAVMDGSHRRALGLLAASVLVLAGPPAPARGAVVVTDAPAFVVSINAAEAVEVDCSAGQVRVRVSAVPTVYSTLCASVTSLTVVATGFFVNVLDLASVDGSDFAANPAVSVMGSLGADVLLGSQLDDTFDWFPGDSSDTIDGNGGLDTLNFRGAGADEVFTVNADGTAFELLRNIAGVDLAVAEVEDLVVQAMDGVDQIVINDLTGVANLARITVAAGPQSDSVLAAAQANAAISLTILGGPGADVLEGGAGDDTFDWFPADGNDTIDGNGGLDTLDFRGAGADEIFTVNPDGTAFELLRNIGGVDLAVTEVEDLVIDAMGGFDQIVIQNLSAVADLARITVAAGAQDDTVIAAAQGNAAISLAITGGTGADVLEGGAGDDTFAWSAGDGNDTIDGNGGLDTLVFRGSAGAEVVTVNADGAGFELLRDIGMVVLAVADVETLDVALAGGDDSLSTVGLATTTQLLDGDTHLLGDELTVDAAGSCAAIGPGSIEISGLAPILHSEFEQAAVTGVPPDCPIFADGFESGDTSAWSLVSG